MSIIKYDKKEIRSFRLKYFVNSLQKFLGNNDSIGFFFMYESLSPKDRIQISEQLNNYNLKFHLISNAVYKLLFSKQNQDWKWIKNLFKGGLVWITSSEFNLNNEVLLKKLMKQHNLFLRFVYVNKAFYRAQEMKKFLEAPKVKKDLNTNHVNLFANVKKKIFFSFFFKQYNNN